jgi:hypothetical protein
MKCDEVIRELAVPTADRDPIELAEHLSNCQACSQWAHRVGQLDRLWDLTRAQEPSLEVWDALWAKVTAGLDAAAPEKSTSEFALFQPASVNAAGQVDAAGVRPERSPRARWARVIAAGLIGLAQAAAVLVAVTLARRFATDSQPQPLAGTQAATLVTVNLEIDEGHRVVIHWDRDSAQIDDRTPQGIYAFDDWLTVFNKMEGLSTTAVAMQE